MSEPERLARDTDRDGEGVYRLLREEEKVLSAFFADGRLKALPARLKKRLLILRRFAGLFEPEAVYPEREVNGLIAQAFDDYCTIRRELVDWGFMSRSGGEYRLLHGADWLPKLPS